MDLKVKYSIKTILWILNGYFGGSVSLDASTKRVTVLVTYFNPLRMKNINHQIRNILKCAFVDRIVISNHNPEISLDDLVNVKDKCRIVSNQIVRRGCGFRWVVAHAFHPDYLIVVDDDMLLFSWQFTGLFQHLLDEPGIPHGFSGLRYIHDGHLEFHDREDILLIFFAKCMLLLAIIFVATWNSGKVLTNDSVSAVIDSTADFLVISQTGDSKPKNHNTGYLFRDGTFNMETVAIYKDEGFEMNLQAILAELDALELLRP